MKNEKKILLVILGILVSALAALVVVVALRGPSSGGYDTLPIEQYVKTPRSLGGNTFTLDGRIDTQLAYKSEIGRVIAVRTQDGKAVLPIIVLKEKAASFNPRVGQPYRLTLEVGESGELLLVESQKL